MANGKDRGGGLSNGLLRLKGYLVGKLMFLNCQNKAASVCGNNIVIKVVLSVSGMRETNER